MYSPAEHPKYRNAVEPINKTMLNVLLCRTDLSIMEPLKNYDICIYVDGNAIIDDPKLIENILRKVDERHLLVASQHPYMNSIYSELDDSERQSKYQNNNFEEQRQRFIQEKYEDENLYWNGFVWYLQPFSDRMLNFYENYTQECLKTIIQPSEKIHYQDQIVFSYVVWKCQLTDNILKLPIYYNEDIPIKAHVKTER